MGLLVSLRSELIKIKRSASLKLCLVAAVLIPVLLFIEEMDSGRKGRAGIQWHNYFMGGHEPVNLVLLPLYIILTSTLLLQIEYRDKTWKQVLTSPQRLINVFLAKYIILHLLILLFLVCYNLWLAIGALGIDLIHPRLYNGGFNLYELLVINTQSYFLIFGISAIQFWLSLRFKNFIAPLAIGFCLWFLAPLMIFELKWAFADMYPYSFSILGMVPKYRVHIVSYQWYSIVNAIFFLSVAFIDFTKNKVTG